ncbi:MULTISPECIES: DUF2076 domain-containing protein [unclassified Bradyrhizobium]|uniref:DUF2076 domain-containing protein n=1 Tax=unclassified Bradyrhizobium TaxID=2631580 RepID=UPI0028EB293B|nr:MULTISPECIES: DUF2076 domain-containing protein [unclassified Bradyrhizobium]
MTPQERQLIDDLFDRLARLESAPRDAQAAAAISQGLQQAPNAVYALVQTVLVQDEALKRANARIEELQHAQEPQQGQSGSFLDTMRDSIFGSGGGRGSVPNVPPPSSGRPVWNSGQALPQGQPGYPPQPGPYDQGGSGQPRGGMFGGGGGSFLGTAAAAAAGMVGGSLLLGGIRSMMGGGQHQAFGDTSLAGGGGSPWSDQSSGSLARDAGLDDIGRSGDGGGRAGLFDQASYDDGGNDADAADFDADDGYGNDDDGGSDYA